ncbi:hypothetical protein [Streptomyces mirabilis]|uniref:hypothetical protein n=1 Tax=Streptomyces mirabilis TaxID=68239 RepID=UPI0033BCD329
MRSYRQNSPTAEKRLRARDTYGDRHMLLVSWRPYGADAVQARLMETLEDVGELAGGFEEGEVGSAFVPVHDLRFDVGGVGGGPCLRGGRDISLR